MSQNATPSHLSRRLWTCLALGFVWGLAPAPAYADTAREHFDLGIKNYKSSKLDDAVTEFQKAHELSPREPTSLFWLGFIYLQERRYQDALQPTQDALQLRPNFADGHLNLGNIYDGLKRYPEAVTEFETAIQMEPNMPRLSDAYYNLGSVNLKMNRKPEAIAAFQKAASIAPNDGYVEDGLGYAYQASGDFDRAVAAHQLAVKATPANANFWLNLGLAQQSLARKQTAVANPVAARSTLTAATDSLAHAANLAPNDFAVREAYGESLYDAQQNTQAVEQFRMASRLNPKDARPLYNIGLTQTRLKHYGPAAEAFQGVLQISPNNVDALRGLGVAQYENTQYAEAAQTYIKLTTLAPTDVSAWTNYSLALQNQGRPADAAKVLEDALTHVGTGKNTIPLRLGLAGYLYQKGGADALTKARNLYQQVLQADATNADAHNGLGLVAQKERRYDDAIASFKRAVALNPRYDDAYNNLGIAYEAKGDVGQAVANCRKAVQINPKNTLAKDNLARLTKTAPPKS